MARTNPAAYGALGLHAMGEYGQWVAILVWAFGEGGASRAALVAVITLLTSAVCAPLISAGTERLDPTSAYRLGAATQTVLISTLTVLLFVSAPTVAIIAVASLGSGAFTSTRPAHYGLLPHLLDNPQHLIVAVRRSRVAEMAGACAGPFLIAAALAFSDVSLALALSTIAIGGSFVCTLMLPRTPLLRETQKAVETIGDGSSLVERLRRQPGSVGVLLIGAIHFAVIGALDLLTVALAVNGNGNESFAGILTGCFGLGSFVAVTAARNRTPTLVFPGMATGAVVFLGFIIATAVLPRPIFAVSFLIAGAALASVDTGNRALLPRSLPSAVLGRIYGLQETAMMVGLAVGALLTPLALEALGLTVAFVCVGAILPIVVLAQARTLRRLDGLGLERSSIVGLVAESPLFREGPSNVTSAIAFAMEKVHFEPGSVLIRQHDSGDCLFLIAEGSADVSIDGDFVRTVGLGAHIGEVALLRQSPRTATVIATTQVLAWQLDSEAFLIAVNAIPGQATAIEAAVAGYRQ